MGANEALVKNDRYDPQCNLYDALPEMKMLSNSSKNANLPMETQLRSGQRLLLARLPAVSPAAGEF